jgi:hypothetical protein
MQVCEIAINKMEAGFATVSAKAGLFLKTLNTPKSDVFFPKLPQTSSPD